MKPSCVLVFGLALGCAANALALDATRTLHHKAAEPGLKSTHHAGRRASAHVAHAGTTVAAGRSKGSTTAVHHTVAATTGTAHLRRAAITTRHHYYERFTASSFASGDIFAGDVTAGEDSVVRQAAIDALDGMNGTAVVINPANGRILAMVNQKLALSPGAEPCSTIKLSVGLAALSEGLVTRDTPVNLGGFRMNM